MQLIGETIHHEQFGKGVVTACDHNIITINFPTGIKRFVYPDAFQAFLIPKDGETREEINDMLVEQKLKEKQKELADLERQKKLAHLRSLKISNNGQAVFDLANQEGNDPLHTGFCETGTYLSGFSKGEFRVPQQLAFNSLCILTSCPEGAEELQRQIVAVAMTEESFEGAACEDGRVPLHEEFRLTVKNPIRLWPLLGKEPRKTWGRAAFRYVSNPVGEEILYTIRQQYKGTPQEAQARALYSYYCDCNRLVHR